MADGEEEPVVVTLTLERADDGWHVHVRVDDYGIGGTVAAYREDALAAGARQAARWMEGR